MEKTESVKKIAEELLEKLGLAVPIAVSSEEDGYNLSLTGGGSSALLIGYHGETLNSLQTLISLLVYRQLGEKLPLIVDVDGYRKERMAKLKAIAVRACDKARFLNMAQSLPPMNAFERRLVHLFVSEITDMRSESVGEGRDRQVVIQPKSLSLTTGETDSSAVDTANQGNEA